MSSPENAFYYKLELLIVSNLGNEVLSTDYICQELGVSRTKLHRILKQKSQLSLSLFIRNKRIEKSRELLLNSDMRISEIANEVGINSHQNFTKYFTEEFHINPTEFRKKWQSNKHELEKYKTSNSIAVLPFVNMSDDAGQEYFSDGITEEIINALAQVPTIKVVGRTSSFAFKNKNHDLRHIGSVLGVENILEGSVRKSGNVLRITAQLIKAKDGYHLWSEKYDCELKDIFEIQDEISLAILKEIKAKLFGPVNEIIPKRKTINPDAHRLYLKGLFYLNKFAGTDLFYKAIDYFKQALALEPNYLECHTSIASCYIQLWFFSQVSPEESILKAQKALQKAMEIEPENVNLLIRKGHLKTWYEWDLKGAQKLFEEAYQINPGSGELNFYTGMCYTFLEKYDLALSSIERAISNDPLSGVLQLTLSWCYWHKGDFDQSEIIADKLIQFKPYFWGGHHMKGLNLLEKLNLNEAAIHANKANELYPSSMNYALLAHIYNFSGDSPRAKEIADKLELNLDKFPVSKFDVGHLYVALGELKKAQLYFQEALDTHEGRMLFLHKAYRKAKAFKLHPQFSHFFNSIEKVLKA